MTNCLLYHSISILVNCQNGFLLLQGFLAPFLFRSSCNCASILSNYVYVQQLGKAKSGRKAKAEPSREDMHAVVVDILKEVDFNTVSLVFCLASNIFNC